MVTAILVMLCLAATRVDITTRKIPNAVPLCLLALATAMVAGGDPSLSLTSSLGGLGLCLMVTLPMYLAGGLGAGDVKLLTAGGAVVGTIASIEMLLVYLVLAGVVGLLYLLQHPGRRQMARRLFALRHLPTRGKQAYQAPLHGDPGRSRLPMAPVISLALLWAHSGARVFT